METKKRMLLLAAVSIALLTGMTAAGTFAYLQGGSDDVVNNFQTGKVEMIYGIRLSRMQPRKILKI